MSGIILRSRALERPPSIKKTTKANKQNNHRRPRISKKREGNLKLQKITETVKDQLLKNLNTAGFILTDPSAADREKSRFDQLLKVHEQHLEKLKNLKEKYLELERENETIKSGNAESLNAIGKREKDLRRDLEHQQIKAKDLESSNKCRAEEVQNKIQNYESKARRERESSERLLTQLDEEKRRRQEIESELQDATKQLDEFAKDPVGYDTTDLGEIYAEIFEVDAGEVNHYEIIRGKKTVTGPFCWFETLVKAVLTEINEIFLGLLEGDTDWFINFVFRHSLQHHFCEYMGRFNEYRRNQLQQMTKCNRNAFDKMITNERFKLIKEIAFALEKECYDERWELKRDKW